MAKLEFDENTGVSVPAVSEVRADIAAKVVQALRVNDKDPDVSTEPSTPMGQLIDIITAEVMAKNSELAFLANMGNPKTASGVFLDAMAGLYELDRKISEPTVVTCICRGLRGTIIPYGAIVSDSNGNKFRHSVASGSTIGEDGTVEAPFSAVDHGALDVPAETVSKIVTVIAGWDSVINPAPGVTGRYQEPDGEFLHRIRDSYAINAHGSRESIETNLAQLEGVLDVVVLENYTNQYQTKFSVRLEPHSIAVCIVGGEDADIAECIYRRKDLGCGTNGETEVTYIATDHFNAKYTYQIIRPQSSDFKVRVSFFDKTIPTHEQELVKAAVVSDFLGELQNARVKLATSVAASRFYRAVQNVTEYAIREILISLDDGEFVQQIEIPANVEPSITAENVELVFGAT